MLKKVGRFILKYKFIILGLLIASFGILGYYNTKRTFSEKTYSTIWDGTIATEFERGTGTELDPYIISDGSQLAYFFHVINMVDSTEYSNKFYELENNINLNNYDFSQIKTTKSFNGVLDGNGYTISNFTLNNCALDETSNITKCSLFNELLDAEIKNINFSDASITVSSLDSNTEVSFLANNAEGTIIKNISFSNISLNQNIVHEEEIPETTPVEETETEETTDEIQEETQEESIVEQEEQISSNEEPVENIPESTTTEEENQPTENQEEPAIEQEMNLASNHIVATPLLNTVTNDYSVMFINEVSIEETYEITASTILATDNGSNLISNIHISLDSNISNKALLIYNYKDSEVNNIVTNNNLSLDKDNVIDTLLITYQVNEDGITFDQELNLDAVLNILGTGEELSWTYSNDTLRLINNGTDPEVEKRVPTLSRDGTIDAEPSGKSGNIVYVNNLDADRNYYLGLNYTDNAPSINYSENYSDTNLVRVQANYYGYSNWDQSTSGYVSALSGESNINQYTYYKVYPTYDCSSTSGKCIEIDLIDNPWSKRPTGKMFNGWYTLDNSLNIELDVQTYTRSLEVPVTFNGTTPNDIILDFYTSWVTGISANTSSGMSSALSSFASYGMTLASSVTTRYIISNVEDYYIDVTISRGQSYLTTDYYKSGTRWYVAGNRTCTSSGGCEAKRKVDTGASYDENITYYSIYSAGKYGGKASYRFTEVEPSTPVTERTGGLLTGDKLVGYYKKITLSRNASQEGYYKPTSYTREVSSGWFIFSSSYEFTYYKLEKLTGTCQSSSCTVYEYMPYYEGSEVRTIKSTDTSEYYYYTTRDTNILFLNNNFSGFSASTEGKPFTLTAYNGSDNYSNYYASFSGSYTAEVDFAIDYVRISTTTNLATGTSTPGNGTYINCQARNVKIGRNVKSTSTSKATFGSIISSQGSDVASSATDRAKYNILVESGAYNSMISISNSDGYFDARTTYGNDFDRVTDNNSAMEVRFVVSGFYNGSIQSDSNNADYAGIVTVKSGKYGTTNSGKEYTTGIYAGGRNSGQLYAPTKLIVEGGEIFNITGGPYPSTSVSSATNKNMINIYIKGGTVDNIFGGAGKDTTTGHRIIQITGGTINYAVCGGSNGVTASSGSGQVSAKTFIYIGGTAIIGSSSLDYTSTTDIPKESVSQTESGSVFGSGNGGSNSNSSSTVGDTLGTNIVIAGGLIRRNVYAGGNYGSMGSQGSSAATGNIKIVGGTINGNVYGGGNSNGVGQSSKSSTSTITMTGGTVQGAIYGGSNTEGTLYGSSIIKVTGGTVGNVYGGGKGSSTIVRDSVSITIGEGNSGPTINHSVYGGSEEGQVNTAANKATTIAINKGTILEDVYGGGNNNGIGTSSVSSSTTITMTAGTVTGSIYGGANTTGVVYGPATITVTGGNVGNIFGGGRGVNTAVRDNIIVTVGTSSAGPTISGSVYGGSKLGTVNSASSNPAYDSSKTVTVTVNNGRITGSVFGGAKGSSSTTPYIAGNLSTTINGGNIGNVFGGFDENGTPKGSSETSCVVTLNGGTIGNAYGGGNATGVNRTNITLNGATITGNIFGGSNQSGNVTSSYLYIKSGSATNAFGGNNLGGTNANPILTMTGGTIKNSLYGSGNKVGSTTTTVTINTTDGNISIGEEPSEGVTYPGAFGGANQAAVTTTNLTIAAPTGSRTITISNAFGGSNASGDVTTANLTINGGTITNSAFGGNNQGGTVTTPNIIVNNGTIGNAYGGNNLGGTSNNTDLKIYNGTIGNAFGGGNAISVTNAKLTLYGGTITGKAFGGSNSSGTVTNTTVTTPNTTQNLRVNELYGGNNLGGSTTNPNVTITSGTITRVFGGGNQAPANVGTVVINDGTISTVFGGGNQANIETNTTVTINNGTIGTIYTGGNEGNVTGSTTLKINGGTINSNAFGGGYSGTVGTNSIVNIKGGNVRGNLYGGGYGSTATVLGNNTVTVSGAAIIGYEGCTAPSQGSVFGGGNAAATGSTESNNSIAAVNIAGGTIYGNVYGGAYGFSNSANELTSKIYGHTNVTIGAGVTTSSEVLKSNITIYGTIFGGGEKANNSDENYNFNAISVTQGISINIDGTDYSVLDTYGSIFGSGNASSSSGDSVININNYGTRDLPHSNISIQRTNLLTINNSHIILSGTTDSTNDYSDVSFTLSRIDELDLKNNSTLYLYNGSNLLKKFVSQTASGAKATVEIETDEDGVTTVNRNVDNRVYMYPGKVLNIATTQNVSQNGYGEVSGMTYFGMFKADGDGYAKTGIYQNTTEYPTSGTDVLFETSTYVLGEHMVNHDIEVDGFYSNFYEEPLEGEEGEAQFSLAYIEPTPSDASYYMWQIGEGVMEIEVELTASKFSTLGTKEVVFNQDEDLARPNTSFIIDGFDYTELESGCELIEKSSIPRLASTSSIANSQMGLRIEASNQGWLTTGHTDFVSNNAESSVTGVTKYVGSNTNEAPTLLMYLYHSKNIDTDGEFGTVKISIQSITQVDDLTKSSKRLLLSVHITRAIYENAEYEASITPGRKYELFPYTSTSITNKSTFSAYFSLFDMSKTDAEGNETYDGNVYEGNDYRHVLTTNYALPAGTKITMIDLSDTSNPEYFYHVITAAEESAAQTEIASQGDYRYDLSGFERMGAYNSGVYYDDEKEYYNSTLKMTDEEFIFIVDFEDTNITSDVVDKSIYMEMISDDPTVPDVSLLSIQRDTQVFSLYTDNDASIEVNGSILDDKTTIYTGDNFKVEANININQQNLSSTRQVYDTKSFDSKLGVKLTLINSDNEVVSGTSLIGLTYTVNDTLYSPNIDGTTRIKVADRVDKTKLRINVDTGTSNLETGAYKLRIEAYTSTDGIYYGLTSSSYIDLDIYIVNEIYGLKVEYERDSGGTAVASPDDMILSSETGKTQGNKNNVSLHITYSSGLSNANLKIRMYRRTYDEVNGTTYEQVEICDYLDHNYNAYCAGAEAYTHTVISNLGSPASEYVVLYPLNYSEMETLPASGQDHLKTGTYKLEFILYETVGTTEVEVGTVEKYIIIR